MQDNFIKFFKILFLASKTNKKGRFFNRPFLILAFRICLNIIVEHIFQQFLSAALQFWFSVFKDVLF
jgi:hypothetical protein